MSIQSYKELLFSGNVSGEVLNQFENPNADYCVAIGETLYQEDDRAYQTISLQKGIWQEKFSGICFIKWRPIMPF